MTEQIGKITLDYTYYPGEDLYCDGAVEDELLEIVKEHKEDFDRVIEEKASWPILYHLSPLRANIIDWIPMDKSTKVLEVGSGCGAITGRLSQKAGSVTCIDLSKKRSHINAYRHLDCDNVHIHVGNFKDIEPELPSDYDYILLIGVFEYAQGYMGTQTPYEDFMKILKKHLKNDGRMVIAIENKFGMKYWAGCREDHLGDYFSSIENYPRGGGVRTFTRNGLENICKECGVENYFFYYPYPDYKFMTTVYSDAYLPKAGELTNNFRNFDRDRLLLFDEKNAFDSVIQEGLFPLYSNSYVLVIGKDLPVKYSKFSNDRKADFAIRTDIIIQENGNKYVEKYPLNKKAISHVEDIKASFEKLSARYKGSKLKVNCLEQIEEGLRFEFVGGRTLEELLDECLSREDFDRFENLFDDYLKTIDYGNDVEVTDYDMIFSNILVDGEIWNLIDYEWTFPKKIQARDIAYRALYCYGQGVEKRKEIVRDFIAKKLEISKEEIKYHTEAETEFQKEIAGDRLPMGEIRNRIGYSIVSPIELQAKYLDGKNKKVIQIYEDNGSGYSEVQSFYIRDGYRDENTLDITLKLHGPLRAVRIDPAFLCCIAQIEELSWNGKPINISSYNCSYNGKKLGSNGIVFENQDPHISIKLTKEEQRDTNILRAVMKITEIPEQMGAMLQNKINLRKIF